MTDLNIDGMAIAPGVIETIVSSAAQSVEGVHSVGDPTTSGIKTILGGGKPSTQGINVDVDEDNQLFITVRLFVKNGQVLPDLAAQVRQAIEDAVRSQTGLRVASVDIFIDGIQFDN